MSETLEMIAFGPFRLETDSRQLTCNCVPVTLSSRGFDILVLLAENRDRVVTKDEIMARVWRGMIVEENNLAVQISALRRALSQAAAGCGAEAPVIVTVPGQGYRFVARLRREAEEAAYAGALPATALSAAGPAPSPAPALAASVPAAVPVEIPVAIPPPPGANTGVVSATSPSRPAAGRTPVWRSPLVMGALAVCVLALAGFELIQSAPAPLTPKAALPPPPPRLSIAVLPFRDLSDDRCCDYLADAISDDLTTELSLIPGSVVIARESADMFRGHPAPADAIGRSLHVRYLLEGSVRSVEGIFSINAQLIEASTGGHLWAERFTVPRTHLADAQNVIVQRLASALGVKLVDIEGARSLQEHPANPDAMDLFLRARSVLDRSDSLESMNQAQALLEQARARAPNDVKILSELGWLLPRKIHNYATPHREADLAEARQVTGQALAIAPGDPAVLVAKAALQLFDENCADAQRSFQLALDAQPDSVRALTGLNVCKFNLGLFADAEASLSALLRIDPESPRNQTRFYQMGFARLMLGDPNAALPWLYKSIASESESATGNKVAGAEWKRLALIAATRLAGDTEASDSLFATYRIMWPNRTTWALEARSPKGLSAVPGFRRFLMALQDAGMPRFADERVGPPAGACGDAMYTPTPHTLPNVETIDTAAVAALLQAKAPLLVDVGIVGAAVPPHGELSMLDPASAPDMARLLTRASAIGAGAIVVMASNAYDPRGCSTAAALARVAGEAAGPRKHILWYRGGEEAWAAAGQPYTDAR